MPFPISICLFHRDLVLYRHHLQLNFSAVCMKYDLIVSVKGYKARVGCKTFRDPLKMLFVNVISASVSGYLSTG